MNVSGDEFVKRQIERVFRGEKSLDSLKAHAGSIPLDDSSMWVNTSRLSHKASIKQLQASNRAVEIHSSVLNVLLNSTTVNMRVPSGAIMSYMTIEEALNHLSDILEQEKDYE